MRRGWTVVETVIVIAIVGLLLAIAVPSFMKASKCVTEEPALYSAWCKHTGNKGGLTFEEWKALRRNGLLTERKR